MGRSRSASTSTSFPTARVPAARPHRPPPGRRVRTRGGTAKRAARKRALTARPHRRDAGIFELHHGESYTWRAQKTGGYEWAGVFDLTPGGKYAWIAQKTDGAYVDATMQLVVKEVSAATEAAVLANDDAHYALVADYADPAMKIVVIEVAPASESEADLEAALEGAEAAAEAALEGACAVVNGGGSVVPGAGCHTLTFDASASETTFSIDVPADRRRLSTEHGGHFAIFAEHVPIEFEHDAHYLQDDAGVDVEPMFEEGGGGHAHGHRRLNSCADVASGAAIGFDTCNTLVFDEDLYTSTYLLEVPTGGTGKYAFYGQHYPTEFELDSHYLKDDHGDDVEPVLEVPAAASSKPSFDKGYAWRNSMLATFLVLVCTFCGVLSRLALKDAIVRAREIIPFASAMGTGALFGCAVFLMMIEGSHLVGARWPGEVDTVWRWGTAVLGGYLVGMLTELAFPRTVNGDTRRALTGALRAIEAEPADAKAIKDVEDAVPQIVPDYAFCFNIFFGDFWHNLVDGIFIAHSFLQCESGQGWVVTAGTIYHELVQEFGDFFLLVGPGGLTVVEACLVNFASGTSVMLGAMIYLWTEPGMGTQGILLAFSAGVYTYVACTEACGEMLKDVGLLSARKRFGLVLCFAVGAIGIGLILLDHDHCSVKVADGAADPHNH